MMRAWAIALAVVLLSGCVGSEPGDDGAETASEALQVDPDRPRESFGDVETGEAVGPDLNATTAAAPRLVMGEWWRVKFHAYLGEGDIEVVRVVADVNDEGYVMGMPHSGWLKEAISFHSPAFGDVNADLSYNTHNMLFQPVRFPIEAGDSWETHFAGMSLVATVGAVDDYTATIRLAAPESSDPTTPLMEILGLAGGADMELLYDARQHEIVRMESALGLWEVVEHGYGFEGWVTVPRGEDTAIDYGTFGPASETHTPMARTLEVEGGFNRMTMMHFVGTLNDAPAYLKARDVTPDGEEFVTEMQDAGFQLRFYETAAPDGTWTVEDVVVGAGFTYHMGIAYHQYDIKLPNGERRSDHSHPVIR